MSTPERPQEESPEAQSAEAPAVPEPSAPEPAASEASAAGEAPAVEPADESATADKQKDPALEKRWYIVHTYSGHEQKAKRSLLERARTLGKQEFFDEVLIPEETVVEVVKGEKRTSKRKFFPGYILVRMVLSDETWHIVRDTPKITGFVGGATKPPPISDEEVARMTEQIKEGAAKPKPKILFDEGENVRVTSGPFANFSGYIDEVMAEKEKLKVMVHVFGRASPVVLDYTNVEKA